MANRIGFRWATLLALIALSACGALGHPIVQGRATVSTDPSTHASPTRSLVPQDLLIVGDSLMVGARDIGGLEGLLDGTAWIPEIVAQVGAGVPWALDQVEQRVRVPHVVLVEMGTNPGPGLGDFANEVQHMIDALEARGARRIVWIPPVARDPMRYADRDAVIEHHASGSFLVSRWPGLLEQNPQWFGGEFHLTEEGYRQLALYIRDEMAPLHG